MEDVTLECPSSSVDVNTLWLNYILTNYERKKYPRAQVFVQSFGFISDHVDSFNADLVMLYVKSTIKQTPETKLEKRKYNLTVKFLPQNPFQKQVIKHLRYHIKELQMYS
ncbi:hypothetical protein Pmani_001934 [Petrolisthes manimaculis]|uniref:Uncharacterized protein n=1 Tax=Petrolisthes manimaculis TaxID=1843537 RepID=A0AAE1UJU5_9EUCA|nr:hypothetical protein Pmani_032033 [Petrolisthes manimaculis]KAK4327603.1 hypothetical protein Pmani_001934 [Petrolisthes manimaculis]